MKKTILNTYLIKEVNVNTDYDDDAYLNVLYYDNQSDFNYEGNMRVKGERDRIDNAYLEISKALSEGRNYVEIEL